MRRMFSENQIKELADERVETLVEGGTLDNAKPIYWHSCTLKRVAEGSLIYFIDFIIINNDETPLTISSFSQWLSDHQDAEIKAVQGYDKAKSSNLISYFKYDEPTIIKIYSVNLTTGNEESTGVYMTADYGATLTDNGVNKLN